MYDRLADTNERVSVATGGTQANEWNAAPAISADGRYVVFGFRRQQSGGRRYEHTSGDIFLHDRQTGTTSRINHLAGWPQADNASWAPSISADGYIVAYTPAPTIWWPMIPMEPRMSSSTTTQLGWSTA